MYELLKRLFLAAPAPAAPTTNYYFEAHITIDPVVVTGRLLQLKDLAATNGFRVAKLLMEKGKPSNLDSFMTAKHKSYDQLLAATLQTVTQLRAAGYVVRRYKIENILLDIKC